MISAYDQKTPSGRRLESRCYLRPVLFIPVLFILIFARAAQGAEISQLSLDRENNIILINADLKLDDAQISDLNNGIHKEFIFYVDLFKFWNFWPDEFIAGMTFIRTVKSDPVKKEFTLVSAEGRSRTELRFNSLETLLSQALKIKDMRAFTTDGLQPGNYFVKVTVVSRIRKLAPIIGYLLFFVPEKEFSIERNSEMFTVGAQ